MKTITKLLASALFFVLAFALVSVTYKRYYASEANPKISKLKLQPGFVAEHIMSPSEEGLGSWVAMCFDDKGRLITSDQYGGLYRMKIPAVGAESLKPQIEKIQLENDSLNFGAAQGLLYAFNSLYVMVNNRPSKKLPKTSGLYKLTDTNGDDQYDQLTLLKELVGEGEHGPHSIKLSPDGKSLYVVAGNHTDLPVMNHYNLPKTWAYDNLFTEIKDPRGHANDRKEPGGWVAKVSPDGSNWELMAAGFRNPFDLAFNADGDLFVYDSDMEWDFGTPWYRPTRICHVSSGAEFGWRTGDGKWPECFPDNLPPVLNIGQGSPTNLIDLRKSKFPAKYKNALLAFDWSFGIMHAVHLSPKGATYSAQREEFLSGVPLPLTDGVIGPDGALYFMTGGRRLESDLYRVYYSGLGENEEEKTPELSTENKLRRSLEKYHAGPNPKAIKAAWPNLSHPDRFVRYAARIAIEQQPVAQWQELALNEKNAERLIQSSIALARNGNAEIKDLIYKNLVDINYASLTQEQKIELWRAYELVISRMGQPKSEFKTQIITKLESVFPTANLSENRSIFKLLVNLDAPNAVKKGLMMLEKKEALNTAIPTATASEDLIFRNPQYGLDIAQMLGKVPPMEQTYYAIMLSKAKVGWSTNAYERYFSWYKKAFEYKGGNSYVGFLDRARKIALANAPKEKQVYYNKISGGENLSKSGNDLADDDYPKGPWRNWKSTDALALFKEPLANRDFKNGKAMFQATTCLKCHGMQGEGGNIGPDLSSVGTRFGTKDILEAIMDPNKSISDQYAATSFQLKNGETLVGRIISENETAYQISQNPFAPDMLQKVLKKNVTSKEYSSVSLMMPGLINSLNEEELKNLMAYLVSGGNPKNSVFKQ